MELKGFCGFSKLVSVVVWWYLWLVWNKKVFMVFQNWFLWWNGVCGIFGWCGIKGFGGFSKLVSVVEWCLWYLLMVRNKKGFCVFSKLVSVVEWCLLCLWLVWN